MRIKIIYLILTAAILTHAGAAMAQQDDFGKSDDFTADLAFDAPYALQPRQTYDFEFTLSNTSESGDVDNSICQLEMFVPEPDYDIDENYIYAPEALHGGVWTTEMLAFHDNYGDIYEGVRWEYVAEKESRSLGDISEGESLGGFGFRATTDQDASDGFDWAVWSDDGTLFIDVSCVIPENCDETDDDFDDDTASPDDDADDDIDDDLNDDLNDDSDDNANDDANDDIGSDDNDDEWPTADDDGEDTDDDSDSTSVSCGC